MNKRAPFGQRPITPAPKAIRAVDATPAQTDPETLPEKPTPEVSVDFVNITRAEFIQLASNNKVRMLESLAAEMLVIGYAAANAQADFYTKKLGDDHAGLAEATALRNKLDVKYDVLKHVTSALQSALKVERLGLYSSE